MKYDIKEFNASVSYYKKKLRKISGKDIFLIFDKNDLKAFLSIAPLSMAAHELGKDMHCSSIPSHGVEVLFDVWECYDNLKKGEKSKPVAALKSFIGEGKKHIKGFDKIFLRPGIILEGTGNNFSYELSYKHKWFKEHRKNDLNKTASILWKQLVNIKKSELVGLGFELVPKKSELELPLEDYLDSYPITWAMKEGVNKNKFSLGASTSRKSMLMPMERVSDLKTTLLGCELDKKVTEPVFKAFKKLSKELKIDRLKPNQASFFIHGKGYSGMHSFGQKIGYPTANKKSRWESPGGMIYKLDFYPQTKLEPRAPIGRVAFTETLPIDVFIKSSMIDWHAMERRNQKIISVCDKCEKIFVKGRIIKGKQTNLEVGLRKKDGGRRWVRSSGTDTREIVNKEFYKKTGIKAGNMANIPGGEAFTTPEYMKGTFIGDVVISLDQSYLLSRKNPLYIECYGNSYKVISGPKKIIGKFNDKKKEAWKRILQQEKNKKIPRSLIKIKKDNFCNIGEFAINTNPKAELCGYLIVNEKIANMIHIALGSGFEPDRATEYHTDIVIDSPYQKMDIWGVDLRGKEHWIIRKGKFVV